MFFLSEQRKSVIVRCSIERPLSLAHLVLLDHNNISLLTISGKTKYYSIIRLSSAVIKTI